MNAQRKKVCVIGAGVSGLAAAKWFKQFGHDVSVVERGPDLGGVWDPSRSYPDVQTQSPKELYRYTDKAMPAAYPEWPRGGQVHNYLAAYADEHALRPLITTNAAVSTMKRGDKGGWLVAVEQNGKSTTTPFDFVAVCTGQFSEIHKPDFQGSAEFVTGGGSVLHSSEYTDPAIVKNRRVVVLGFSKSATDIAVNAVNSGASEVTIVYREPIWRVPYFLGGLLNFKRILYIRAQENMFPAWAQTPMQRLNHAIAKPFIWANWRALESLLNMQLKLGRLGMKPRTRIEDGINCSVPIVTPGFFEMIRDGRIKANQGTFRDYGVGTIALTGGRTIDADVAILATGWKQGVPFLPEADRAKLIEPDGQYRLYRNIVNPDLPDMGFVGFNSSFATVLCADLAANWLVRFADGKLSKQPNSAEMKANIAMMLDWRRNARPAAGRYGGLCIAPYHFKHFDELMDDIGVKGRRRNPLVENLTPPDADAYAGYLKSAPAYQAG
ncbi:MAG TPA: NAD(P)/FAD-dependent oxidoreductase [Mesorhizobium sp.]